MLFSLALGALLVISTWSSEVPEPEVLSPHPTPQEIAISAVFNSLWLEQQCKKVEAPCFGQPVFRQRYIETLNRFKSKIANDISSENKLKLRSIFNLLGELKNPFLNDLMRHIVNGTTPEMIPPVTKSEGFPKGYKAILSGEVAVYELMDHLKKEASNKTEAAALFEIRKSFKSPEDVLKHVEAQSMEIYDDVKDYLYQEKIKRGGLAERVKELVELTISDTTYMRDKWNSIQEPQLSIIINNKYHKTMESTKTLENQDKAELSRKYPLLFGILMHDAPRYNCYYHPDDIFRSHMKILGLETEE